MENNLRLYYGAIVEKTTDSYNSIQPYIDTIFIYLILPLLIILFIFFLIKYKSEFLIWKDKKFANYGYVRIKILQDNGHIITKMIKTDAYNNFYYKDKRYNLDKIQNYILGYEQNIPTILYYNKWIIPLMIREINLEKTILNDLGYNEEDLKNLSKSKVDELKIKVKSIILKTDSTMLNLIYSKKLISDLYNVTMDNGLSSMTIKIILGVIAFIFLWYTGYLEIILNKITNLI